MISGGAFSRTGVNVVPIPRLTYRRAAPILNSPSTYGVRRWASLIPAPHDADRPGFEAVGPVRGTDGPPGADEEVNLGRQRQREDRQAERGKRQSEHYGAA